MFVFALSMAILFIGSAVSAVSYQETQITNDAADQWHPRISYPYAVWIDWRADADGGWVAGGGVDGKNKRDGYLYNFANGTQTKLSGLNSLVTHIDLSNSYVFWLDAGTDQPGLHYYSIFENKFVYAVPIANFPEYSNYGGTYLAAWTDKVAYTTAGSDGIFLYNATTGENKKFSDSFINGLDYEDDIAVYTDTNISGGNVYKHTISTGAVIEISSAITKAASFSDNISMSGNKVIWQTGGTKPNIAYYDLQTGKGKLLTSGEKNRVYPRVGAGKAVWTTYESDLEKSVLTIYDFNSEQLINHGVEQANWPDVASGQIIFSSNRGGKTEIYVIDPDKLVEVVAPPVAEPVVIEEQPAIIPGIQGGDLIKASKAAVYYYGADSKRYVFPNEKSYFTWYTGFSNVKIITDAQLASIEIGGNVTYRPGVKMIKAETSSKVYAVEKGGVRRWVATREVAQALYGADWNKEISDIPDAFWINYTDGSVINSAADYDPAAAMTAGATINIDKGLE